MSPDSLERDLVKCEDMRLYAVRAVEFLGALSVEEFLADELVQSAVIRCVEVVGEAARLVSADTRRRAPGISWPLIVGTRHILAHDYGGVNLDKVHSIVAGDLPELIKLLEPLISELERETNWDADERGQESPP